MKTIKKAISKDIFKNWKIRGIFNKYLFMYLNHMIWKSKIIWFIFAIQLLTSLSPVIIFETSRGKDISLLYASYHGLFVILPLVFVPISVSVFSFLISGITKGNNTDLYLHIFPAGKRKVFINKQIVIFAWSLISILMPVIMTIEFSSYGIDTSTSIKFVFSELLWVLLSAFAWVLLIPSVLVLLKTVISSIAFLFSLVIVVTAAGFIPFAANQNTSTTYSNVYKMTNIDSNLNVKKSQVISFTGDIKQTKNSNWTSYLPTNGFFGNSVNMSSIQDRLSQDELLNFMNSSKTFNSFDVMVHKNSSSTNLDYSNAIFTPLKEESIFQYGNVDKTIDSIEEALKSGELINRKFSDVNYWRILLNLINNSKNITTANFTDFDINLLRESIGLNDNRLKEIYTYSSYAPMLKPIMENRFHAKGFSDEMISVLLYLWYDPSFKFYVNKMNFLDLKNFDLPTIGMLDDKQNATTEDIKYVKDVLFHASFDQSDNLLNVQTLKLNNTYEDLVGWEKLFTENTSITSIKTKTDWEKYFATEKNTVNNIQDLLKRASLAQNNDMPKMYFANNSSNSMLLDGTTNFYGENKQKPLNIAYFAGFLAICVAINLIANRKLKEGDIL